MDDSKTSTDIEIEEMIAEDDAEAGLEDVLYVNVAELIE